MGWDLLTLNLAFNRLQNMEHDQLVRRMAALQIYMPDTSRASPTLSELPTEIVWEVASYFGGVKDYSSLLQVNHRLSSILSQEILDTAIKRHKNPMVRLSVAAALKSEKTVRSMMIKGCPIIVMDSGEEKLHNTPAGCTDNVIRKIMESGPNLRLRCHRFKFSMRGKAPSGIEWAIQRGDDMAVRILLVRGANTAVLDSQGRNLLHIASARKNYLTVAILLEAGFDVNAKDRTQENTPLHYAMEAGNEVALWLLLAKGADTGAKNRYSRTPLDHSFCLQGYVADRFSEISQQILRAAITLELGSRNAPRESQRWSNQLFDHISRTQEGMTFFEKIDKDFLDIYGETWLHRAIQTYKGDLAVLLLDKGVSVNNLDFSSKTPLFHAAERQNLEIFKLLLDRGAEIFAPEDIVLWTACERWLLDAACNGDRRAVKLLLKVGDNDGNTVLHHAIRCPSGATPMRLGCISNWHCKCPVARRRSAQAYMKPIVESMLNHGVKIDIRNRYGKTALHLAAENWPLASLVEALGFLLEKGADAAARDAFGNTALHLLAGREGTRGAQAALLIANGADINSKNSEGMDALHIAADQRNIGIVYVLLHNGSNVDETIGELPEWLKMAGTVLTT